jgi:spermidine synthase
VAATEVLVESVAEHSLAPEEQERTRREALALLGSVFLVAACGLVYELLIATVSSYLLGSSVTQFSISIGLFVGSMGLGSWLSQQVEKRVLAKFCVLELVLGVVGGVSTTLLFWAYTLGPFYWVVLLGLLVLIGTLVGIELPLLVRLLDGYGQLKTIVAQALSFDYLGCLAGSVAFPLLLLPVLGLTRTSFAVGLVNLGVAAYVLRLFQHRINARTALVVCGVAAVLLGAGFMQSTRLLGLLERNLYEDEIIFSKQTPYQRIVVTRWRTDLRLFLDGNLQFSSVDEHRYHETLVHPAMTLSASRRDVLVLGGGDGLAIREVLRYPDVERVTLIDLDPEMTRLGRGFPIISELNRRAFEDPRVRVVNADAYRFLEQSADRYGVILTDLPDPNGDALAKLYSTEFYRLARRHLAKGGVFVTQATSPFFSRESFWCIHRSVRDAGFRTIPLHVYVPSFGDWGFILGAERPLDLKSAVPRAEVLAQLRYLSPELLPTLGVFDRDSAELPVESSTLDQPRILRYYLRETKKWE